MTQRVGPTENSPKFVAAAIILALAAMAPQSGHAAERGPSPLIASEPRSQPSFAYESRVSAARQPAYSPDSARDLPTSSSGAEPEGRLRLRPMALQGGY